MNSCCDDMSSREKKTLIVIILTFVTMIAEIAFGYFTNSMGLLADGYHMGTHALAIGLTYAAYVLIRKFSDSELFPNGTDKIGTLAAYTSSLFLGATGVWIIFEACKRLIHPVKIQFNEAIFVAIIGLVVNLLCIIIMEAGHNHGAGSHEHKDDGAEKDYNFKAAYFHVLADALTSILAIAALIVGKYLGLIVFDPIIGVMGGGLILKWAAKLIKDTTAILVDMKIENK